VKIVGVVTEAEKDQVQHPEPQDRQQGVFLVGPSL
jgi:hypothetical protein